MPKTIVGQKAYIKDNRAEWGIIISHENGEVHLAMYEDYKEVRLFERNEIIVERKKDESSKL